MAPMHRIVALRPRTLVLLSAALLAGALAGCAATPSATREYQDPRTAVTVTVAGRGLLFAEALASYAVNARRLLASHRSVW